MIRSKSISLLFTALFLICACQNSGSPATRVSSTEEQKINRLLSLIDQRLDIASQVAKSKWNTGSPVNDTKREQKMLNDIGAQAKAIGQGKCDPIAVQNFFEDQFIAGKIIQTHLLITWRNTYPAKYKFNDAPNLAREIRPQLDKLTPELIAAFCDAEAILNQASARKYLFSQADKVVRGDVNGAARRETLQAFKNPIADK